MPSTPSRQRGLVTAGDSGPPRSGLDVVLRADPEAQRLVRALSLSRRFHVFIVRVGAPRLAGALVRLVEESLGVPVSVLSPYGDPWRQGAVDRDNLAEAVLQPLALGMAADRVVVVDASPAGSGDADAWRWAFQRLNERREQISRSRQAAVVFLLPEWLHPEFINLAPDLWSIRSGEYELRGELLRGLTGELPAPGDIRTSPDHASRAAMEAGLAHARERLRGQPEDATQVLALQAWLLRKVELDLDWGHLTEAEDAAREALELGRALEAREPQSVEAKLAVLGALEHVARVASRLVRPELSIAALREASERASSLVAEAREPAIRIRHAAVLSQLGVELAQIGQFDEAEMMLRHALGVAEELVREEPENRERAWILLAVLGNLGRVLSEAGRHSDAMAVVRRAESRAESLASSGDTSPFRARDLSILFVQMGDLLTRAGAFSEAVRSYRRALALREALTAADPENVGWLEELGDAENRLAHVLVQAGYLNEAQAHGERAVEFAERVSAVDPASRTARWGIARAHSNLAGVAALVGSYARALDHWEAARSALLAAPPGPDSAVEGTSGPEDAGVARWWRGFLRDCEAGITSSKAAIAVSPGPVPQTSSEVSKSSATAAPQQDIGFRRRGPAKASRRR